MYNVVSTSTALGNTGLQNFPGNVGKWKYLLLVPKGTEIATEVLALTKATYTASMNAAMASRWFCLPMIFNGEPDQEEPQFETSDFGYESLVRDGKLKYTIRFEEMSVYNKTQLFKLNNGKFDGYIITDKDIILGFTQDGIKFLPYQFDYTRVLPESQNTGSANARVSFILKATDIRQFNDYQVRLDPVNSSLAPAAWYPSIELPNAAIKDLVITLVSLSATSATITLAGYDEVPYSGAVKEDVYLRKTTETGTAITLTSLTESATIPGTYTAVIPTQTSGTFYCSLYDQPVATTEGVETPVVSSYVATIA